MGKRKKMAGHFCWACGCRRPNERFSGKGHAKHVCRDCAKLGAEELMYRQDVRNLERCITWEGFIRAKERDAFERFLQHEDARIRAMAEEFGGLSAARLRTRSVEADELAEGAAYLDVWALGSVLGRSAKTDNGP